MIIVSRALSHYVVSLCCLVVHSGGLVAVLRSLSCLMVFLMIVPHGAVYASGFRLPGTALSPYLVSPPWPSLIMPCHYLVPFCSLIRIMLWLTEHRAWIDQVGPYVTKRARDSGTKVEWSDWTFSFSLLHTPLEEFLGAARRLREVALRVKERGHG